MIKILSIFFSILLVILGIFGFLILLEYLKYYKRKIVLRLREKLRKDTK